MSPELEGRLAVITGAASGIGAATAAHFAAEGAQMLLVDRDGPTLERLVSELSRAGATVHAFEADVSDPVTALAAVAEAVRRLGGVDVLVNNAGIAFMATVDDTSPEEWDRVFAVNVRSVYAYSRAALPALRSRGGGAIVNTASEAGIVGFAQYAAYSASKAAVVNLTRSMAVDHAPDRIRVNCVCPGSIETPLLVRYYEAQADPAAARGEDEQTHPLGIGQPQDIANAICFLASERSAYVTGHALVVDGGYTCQ